MNDELELDLNEEQHINKTEERIKNLSSKVREKAQETAAERELREAAESKAATLEKERDFYQSFSTHASKFPNASEHIDAIKEKVLAGYAPEDAIVSVLNAKGALMPQSAPIQAPEPVAGGSAPVNLTGETKPLSEMTRDEMRAKLVEADSRGELAEAIRNIR